jgi:uncharacterized membrane protein
VGGRRGATDRPGMKRAEVLVLGGAVFAASGALILLDTAVTAVSTLPEPVLAPAMSSSPVAVDLPPLPGTVSGIFESEGKQVPLPPGNWVVMRRAVSQVGPATGESVAPVVSTVLLRLHGHHVDAAVLVQVNPSGASSNWGLAKGCERKDFYHAEIRYASDHDSACSYVTYVAPWLTNAPTTDEAWRLSMQQAVDNGWDVPRQWLEVVYRLSDPLDALQVRYLFDPSPGGPAEKEISAEAVARLVTWSDASWRPVQNGFRDRLKPGAADPLVEWTGSAAEPLPGWRQAGRPKPSRAELKASTNQMLGSLTQFAVAYVYLGSLSAATTLSLATSVVSGAMSYANDLAWSYAADPLVRVPDLPGAGLEQPGPAPL